MNARYRGKCVDCGDWFPEGTEIRRVDDGSTRGGYAHADCAQSEAELAPRPICDRCWLETSVTGRCGCDD